MTDSTSPAETGAAEPVPTPVSVHPRTTMIVQLTLLLAAVAVAVLAGPTAWWRLEYLGILLVLSVISELTAQRMADGMTISGSFLGIMLAAVLLGGTPAMIVGVVTISIGWLSSRERGETFRQNLVMYSWFPLLSGLWFQRLVGGPSLDLQQASHDVTYYLLVFATFMLGLLLNLTMVTVYQLMMDRQRQTTPPSLMDRLQVFKPTMSAELASAILTVLAVLMVNTLQTAFSLVVFAIVLTVFQYLVGELLTSQRRGKELEIMATTDELTGLANRKEFSDQIDAAIAGTGEHPRSFGVMLIDLDHFKDINDTLGHQYGDDLLADLAPRLAQRVGEGGLVARLGGDEFAILPAVRTDNMASMTAMAEDVLACIREPVAFDDITLQVDGSIGIVRYPADGQDAQTLLRRADIAMYAAKEEREGHRFYQLGQDHHSVSRLSMVGDFRRALESDDQILVHFHPIIDIARGKVHGAEALVRWQHPDLGLLQPAAFLDIVEQTGLIGAMTSAVLNRAIAECAGWHAAGRDLIVSVNLSVRNLHDPLLSSQIGQMLQLFQLPPHALKLEITESMILSDPQRALRTVQSLSDLGCRFAVDDFGTGHSSLANLRRLPVHELKIDRSFVTPMLTDESDAVIVRSTIELGHALGLQVIAEGVEDASTLARLEQIRCDRAQGHYFSKPIPPSDFMRWVTAYESSYVSTA
jgi:diguanylate cyclase (GGDEF)-like protein